MDHIKIGTASWTDKSLIDIDTFYPDRAQTAEARLRFYAAHFDTVEVDSSYYGMPSERNARLWVERTPETFTFHMKAYSMLTGHPTRIQAVPQVFRKELPRTVTERSKPKEFPKEIVEAAFDMFAAALTPLKQAERLGCILFQFPPWFVPSDRAYQWLELVREKLVRYRVAVEFRNRRWISSPDKEKALDFLRDYRFCHVVLDAPWLEGWQGPPAVTAPLAYVRLHGRNRKNWFTKGIETVQRYRYLYTDEEIDTWANNIQEIARRAEQTFVLFNNCYQDYGIRNARMLQSVLEQNGVKM